MAQADYMSAVLPCIFSRLLDAAVREGCGVLAQDVPYSALRMLHVGGVEGVRVPTLQDFLRCAACCGWWPAPALSASKRCFISHQTSLAALGSLGASPAAGAAGSKGCAGRWLWR